MTEIVVSTKEKLKFVGYVRKIRELFLFNGTIGYNILNGTIIEIT